MTAQGTEEVQLVTMAYHHRKLVTMRMKHALDDQCTPILCKDFLPRLFKDAAMQLTLMPR